DHQDIAAGDVHGQILEQLNVPGGFGAGAIAADGDVIEVHRDLEVPAEVGRKADRALEHREQDQWLVDACVVARDLGGHLTDAALDRVGADQLPSELQNSRKNGMKSTRWERPGRSRGPS